jgi:hypothetical protein
MPHVPQPAGAAEAARVRPLTYQRWCDTVLNMAKDNGPTKNRAAVALGRRRARREDMQEGGEHQSYAARKRWAGHQPCQCGKCAACRQRAWRKAHPKKNNG